MNKTEGKHTKSYQKHSKVVDVNAKTIPLNFVEGCGFVWKSYRKISLDSRPSLPDMLIGGANTRKKTEAKYSAFYWWKLNAEAKYSSFYWSEVIYSLLSDRQITCLIITLTRGRMTIMSPTWLLRAHQSKFDKQ